jgi:outer membrane protein OmpA-like peptidoglycan-associated protein
MRKRTYSRNDSEDLNVFPAFTDLMTNAFMILSLFLLMALLQAQYLNRKLQAAAPIIIKEESGNFKFKSGSAELNSDLRNYINQEIIPNIESITKTHDIEFIQVIGHTDGQEIGSIGNLDKMLEKVATGEVSVTKLKAGSNADLGLMRALAVIQEIRKADQLKNIEFRAYSAAQLYLPSGQLASFSRKNDADRRRIEIRFIPPGKQQE